MPEKLSQLVVENWISLAKGTFQNYDIQRELGITTPEGKHALRTILARLAEDKKIERVTGREGVFRTINGEVHEIRWWEADPLNFTIIEMPFDIHLYAKLYPKSIVIVAGAKNQGKTEFLYQCVYRNMQQYDIDLYNTETGPEQMLERFKSFNHNMPIPPPFKTLERYDNFADVIVPDHISIIDYLDLNSEIYLVGEEIDRIFRKLTTGIAIIGLQKPPGRDLAYGGPFSAKRAVLYVSLDSHICKLVYVKNPIKAKSRDNMQWTYDFDENGHFCNIQQKWGAAS